MRQRAEYNRFFGFSFEKKVIFLSLRRHINATEQGKTCIYALNSILQSWLLELAASSY